METITVIKRNQDRVVFDKEKIKNAISKGFNSTKNKYSDSDVNKIYVNTLNTIKLLSVQEEYLSIEHIQDLIEKELLRNNYVDVFDNFSTYRQKRSESRQVFKSKQENIIKDLENLNNKQLNDDKKRENANVNGNSPMGMMLHYGQTISKEYAKAYLIDKKYYQAHNEGQIHIHDLDFYSMGTTTCCQIDLSDLFKNGFSTGHGFVRSPQDISSYAALAAIVIQANQNDQHGGQSIPAFDHYLAPGVLKTFKKQFKQRLFEYLDLSELLENIDFEEIAINVDTMESIEDSLSEILVKNNNDQLKKLIFKAYSKAILVTERLTYQAMEAFIANLNTMHSRAGAQVPFSSINFGTDTSYEGRMVTKNYLLSLEEGLGNKETPIFPISIFKVKEGINFNKSDKNYDLFKLAIRVSAKRLFPNFSFLDSPFNLQYYQKDKFESEVAYMGCRTRVISDVTDLDNQVVNKRGNLSFTTINLVRLAIENGIINNDKANIDNFFRELSDLMDLVKDQLLERFKVQCQKDLNNFNFLLKQGVWKNSDTLAENENLKKVLKHGSLSIGFIGLAESLTALIGKHHGESSEAEKLGIRIIEFMRSKVDDYSQKYNLNFTLLATPAEGLSGRFIKIDQNKYGTIDKITDKKYYTNSFHIPVNYPISIDKKLEIEGVYHNFCNAGHISYVEMDGDLSKNLEAFEEVVRKMAKNNLGYGAINHPVDYDPVCGYTGIIDDICPKCQRVEADIKFERIRRITGYLVGTLDRFNNAKYQEVKDRIKHSYEN